ncbi:heme exporter protein D [Xanthomonas sp. F14]
MTALLAMGGYGQYVWTAYAMFVLVLLADLASPWLRRRRLPRELRGQLQRQTPRRTRELSATAPLERDAS